MRKQMIAGALAALIVGGIAGSAQAGAQAAPAATVSAVSAATAQATVTASAVAWKFVRIAVPAYGYFAKHGHCKTEDMVLYQIDYPNSVEWKCVHIDKF